jgi:hypothetical protein
MIMEITQETAGPPPHHIAFLRQAAETGWIERRAKLFEAGDYPDKGVSIAVEDLERLASGFGEPVPVLIEHAESPLQLGFLTAVETVGSELFGTIALSEEANALVEKSGARSLSLGLSPDLGSIKEVSLVRNPRVASAQLYCFQVEWWPDRSDRTNRTDSPRGASDWEVRFGRLQREVAEGEAERRVAAFVAAGKLTPAQAPLAKALLLSDDKVEFDGKSQPLSQLLSALIERQPSHAMFGERAPAANPDYSAHLMLPEEVAFYQKHFPGVSLDEIAKRRPAGAR